MRDKDNLILLSDIHLSAERDRGLFQADGELVAFLEWVLKDTASARVLIAGDFLDFLVPAEGEESIAAFDPKAVVARAAAIVGNHKEVFDALGRLARSDRHELWITNGNHDPELIFSDVREVVEKGMGLPQHPGYVTWYVNGEAVRFCSGDASVVVIHGDVFDDWNRINHGALRRAVNRITHGFMREEEFEYVPPAGTTVVLDYLSKLRESYPWVDVLKPERDAVFRLLCEFLGARELARFKGFFSKAALMAAQSVVMAPIRRRNPQMLVREAAMSRRQQLMQWLNNGHDRTALNDPSAEVIEALRKVSAEDDYFDVTAPDDSVEWLPFFYDRGADLLVAGHTHAAKAHLVNGKNLYVNTGTWARLLQLPGSTEPDERWRSFLVSLREGRDDGSSRPTFARLTEQGEGGPIAELMSWTNGQPAAIVTYRFVVGERAWQEVG